MALDQTPEGLYLLLPHKSVRMVRTSSRSAPPSYNADPGLSLLAKLEGGTRRVRVYDPRFDRHLQAGDIFFDVGAHFGLSRWARQRVCRARSVYRLRAASNERAVGLAPTWA